MLSGVAGSLVLANELKALQILKSVYRNGHISTVSQAAEHLHALIMYLETEDSTDGE